MTRKGGIEDRLGGGFDVCPANAIRAGSSHQNRRADGPKRDAGDDHQQRGHDDGRGQAPGARHSASGWVGPENSTGTRERGFILLLSTVTNQGAAVVHAPDAEELTTVVTLVRCLRCGSGDAPFVTDPTHVSSRLFRLLLAARKAEPGRR